MIQLEELGSTGLGFSPDKAAHHHLQLGNTTIWFAPYLTDRIAVFEGKPQRYGTQFDWDKNEELSPNSFDDLTKVNQRRKSIGLNSLQEQTEIIRMQAKNENQLPPADFEKRRQEIEKWKETVGWTK